MLCVQVKKAAAAVPEEEMEVEEVALKKKGKKESEYVQT